LVQKKARSGSTGYSRLSAGSFSIVPGIDRKKVSLIALVMGKDLGK
jgi:hypothetical protein